MHINKQLAQKRSPLEDPPSPQPSSGLVNGASRLSPIARFPRLRLLALRLALASALAGAGCDSKKPTYFEQVRPILEANCVDCHRAGGIAPFLQLDSFERAAAQAGRIKLAVELREMPPWGVDNSGTCGTFRDAAWLAPRDIATLSAWVDGGSLAGDPRKTTSAPKLPAPRFGAAGATLDTGAPYTPGLGEAGYRCFVTDPGLRGDGLLTALRVRSTDPRSVAQVTLFALDSEQTEAEAARLDEAAPGVGYPCYGAPRTSASRFVASWTWGAPVLRLPAGVRLRAGRKVVIEVHYNVIATGLGAPTRIGVDLELDPGAREARVIPVTAAPLALPAGQRYAEATGALAVTEPLRAVAVAPHMHTLGKVLQLRLRRAGEERCLSNFDHWSFYRQQTFTWAEPIDLAAGDALAVTCAYNTQSRSEPVRAGEGIDKEQCVAYLYVTPP